METDGMVEDAFPSDIWARFGFTDTDAAVAEALDGLKEWERFHGAPRNMELVESFCRTVLPEGDYYVYGAGTHSRTLLGTLASQKRLRIRGIVDRMADRLGSFLGYDVVAPEALTSRRFDYVLLSHSSYEEEMHAALIAAGVPPSRIIALYGNPDFHAFSRPAVDALVRRVTGRRYDYVVISSSTTEILGDETLARVFPPDRTLRIEASRGGSKRTSTLFETVDVEESLTALDRLLSACRPRAVYVSSVLYKNFLGMFIKARHPHTVVVHELCDYTAMWPDRDLANLFGLNDRTIRRLRLAEFFGGQRMDLNLSKRGGVYWDRVWSVCKAPFRLYFPMVRDGDAVVSGATPDRDFLYAGFLPAPSFLADFTSGYTFVPVMREVCERGGMTASIFNAAHFADGGDALYADYIRAFAEGPVRYHPRVPYETLLAGMSGYRYGWLCDAMPELHPDRYVGVCNRWTGYVSGGLPVIIDSDWKLMSDLVRRFEAGVVVERFDAATILAALATADHPRLAQGTAALRRHLIAHNEAILQDIDDAVHGRMDINGGRAATRVPLAAP